MRDVIAERAKRNGRSMNSEIVDIILQCCVSASIGMRGIEYFSVLADPGEAEAIAK
jgi:hypothetical protein